jgi:shikimate dehydrogenase
MKKLGLIGYPLSHSFSAKYFSEKFQSEKIEGYDYQPYPIDSIEKISQLIKSEPELVGLNVTIPYKESVISYLDEQDELSKRIGAVNTIKIIDGKTKGYNTDYYGFRESLMNFITKKFNSGALILGTGGASKAVKAVLLDFNIPFHFVSREAEKGFTYEQLHKDTDILRTHQLVINCTPLGTFPEVDDKPDIPYSQLSEHHMLFDLVYNPKATAFMQAGFQQGASTKNGYDMLVGQAEAAWKIWTNK